MFFLDEDLPADQSERDSFLIRMMGSPDVRQIDGLGGADPLTSKVAIVSRSSRSGVDLEYESLEIGIAEATVNRGIMCGNLLSAVGCFAAAEGLIRGDVPSLTVRIYCRNNGKVIVMTMPAAGAPADGRAAHTPGLPTSVSMMFEHPAGAVTGQLLPTGQVLDTLVLGSDRRLRYSLVDAGTLYAFLPAAEFGLTGYESATALDGMTTFRSEIEEARTMIVDLLNSRRGPDGRHLQPKGLKVAIVGASGPHGEAADLAARVINIAKVHKAYAVSGGICLSAAAAIPGTVVNELVPIKCSPQAVRIAHPTGVLAVTVHYSHEGGALTILGAELRRDARVVMRGTVHA